MRNGTALNNPSYPLGYIDNALSLNGTVNQSVIAPYLPLSNTSFTISAWLNLTAYINPSDHSILGICSATIANQCLSITIRQSSSNYYLYMDFFGSSCQGTINIEVNKWYHVGFVFDLNSMSQLIYLNGILDQSCSVSSPLLLTATTLTTIGSIPLLMSTTGSNIYYVRFDTFFAIKDERNDFCYFHSILGFDRSIGSQ